MWPWPCPTRDQDSVLGGHAPHGRPPDVIDGKNRDVDENIADVLSQSRIVDGNIADVLTKDRSVGEDYFPVTVCAPFSFDRQWTPVKQIIKVKTEKVMEFPVKSATLLFPINKGISAFILVISGRMVAANEAAVKRAAAEATAQVAANEAAFKRAAAVATAHLAANEAAVERAAAKATAV